MATAVAPSLPSGPARVSRVAEVERATIRSVFAPRPRMSVLEWADSRHWLSPEANSMAADAGGPVRFDSTLTPYHRDILLALSDRKTEFVVCMFPSQDGKTEIANIFIGSRIDTAPGPMLMVQPTGILADAWSKDRLAPMLRDVPALKDKVRDARSRDANNTILHKKFPGGHLTIAGSNSPASLAARPIRDVLVDEVDRCAKSAGTEGDSIRLAFRRTTTFRRSKKLLISSPTLKGASRIHDEYMLGTQEEWLVPCPHCHQYQFLKWGSPETKYGIKWDDSRSEPYYCCEHCACVIEERWKPWMNARGRWVARNPIAGPRVRSFFKNALTAALASWRKLRDEWLAVQHKPLELQTFINTVLCELYDPEGGNKIDPDSLFGRLEKYPADVPALAAVLVRVTDTQDDRLETTVWAFGANDEMWLIDFDLLPGNPSLTEGDASPWQEHDRVIAKTYRHESGAILSPEVTFIDSGGHATTEVYQYARVRQHLGVFAIKGHYIESAPLLSRPTRNNSQRALLFMVGSSTAKETIQRRLARIKRPPEWQPGVPVPGFIHLPAAEWMDRPRLQQLANEVRIPEIVDGYVKHVWKKKGPNELFDMAGYALAALQRLGPLRIQQLGDEAERIRMTSQAPVKEPEQPAGVNVPSELVAPQRGGFVNSWRR